MIDEDRVCFVESDDDTPGRCAQFVATRFDGVRSGSSASQADHALSPYCHHHKAIPGAGDPIVVASWWTNESSALHRIDTLDLSSAGERRIAGINDSSSDDAGMRYTMEFKTKAALAEWANDQTMAEIAAHYIALPAELVRYQRRNLSDARSPNQSQ